MKIYAVIPDQEMYCDNDTFFYDLWDYNTSLIINANSDYLFGVNDDTPTAEAVNNLIKDYAYFMECKENICTIKEFETFINDYAPGAPCGSYSADDINRMNNALYKNYTAYGYENDTFLTLLQITTSKNWVTKTICGCCQGDFATAFYIPEEVPNIDYIEAVYWNTGTTYFTLKCSDNEPEPGTHEIILCGEIDYTEKYNADLIKKAIASNYDVDINNVVLYEFAGYNKTAIYNKAV